MAIFAEKDRKCLTTNKTDDYEKVWIYACSCAGNDVGGAEFVQG